MRDDELDKLLSAAYREREQLHAELLQTSRRAPRLAKQAANASRNVLILLLLAGAGLRVSDVCGLNLSDVDLANRTIRVMGKGRKEREVFFDVPEMVQAMTSTWPCRAVLHPPRPSCSTAGMAAVRRPAASNSCFSITGTWRAWRAR